MYRKTEKIYPKFTFSCSSGFKAVIKLTAAEMGRNANEVLTIAFIEFLINYDLLERVQELIKHSDEVSLLNEVLKNKK